MQPIRSIATASAGWLEDLRLAILDYLGDHAEWDDRSLDDLLRYAMHSAGEAEADASGVWKRLCGRVVGPFGRLAVEGPAGCSDPTVVGFTGLAPFAPATSPSGTEPAAPGKAHSRGPGQTPEAATLLR